MRISDARSISVGGMALLIFVALANRSPGQVAPSSNDTVSASEALSLEEIVRVALTNNPSLKAVTANWEAARERIAQAGAWADPRAGFDQNVARFVSIPPNAFTDQKLMIEQTLPVAGRNRLQADAATADAASAFEELRRARLDLLAKTRAAYYRLANAYKQLELNRKNSDLLKQFAEISRAKMVSGNKPQGDVLSAETELAKLDEAQFDFEREISEARTALNVLMNRPPESLLARPIDLAFQPMELSLPNLEALALANRPELAIAGRKVEAAQARLKAARKGWIPEPSVRIEGDRYNGAGQVVSELDAGFSIDLPWFNRSKYRAAINENKKLLEAAQREMEATRNETLGLVVDQYRELETFHHHTELYQSKLLPLARETASTQRAGYESGKAGFLEILTAQQTVRDVESAYWDHLMHYQMALADLQALIGVDLIATTNSLPEPHHQEGSVKP
jgi:outer membrane protein, heavy metal efflux system